MLPYRVMMYGNSGWSETICQESSVPRVDERKSLLSVGGLGSQRLCYLRGKGVISDRKRTTDS